MSYTTIQISELACNIFSQWCLNNPSTISLTSSQANTYKWIFWHESEIKTITVFVKATTKTIENLYFHKSSFGSGLMLQNASYLSITHVCWIDVYSGDSALLPYNNLTILLRDNTNADDFNSFRSNNKDVYVVPLDYIECENIGVRRRNLLSA